MAYSAAIVKSEMSLCKSKRNKEISKKNTLTLQVDTRVRQRSIHRRSKNKILSLRLSSNGNVAFLQSLYGLDLSIFCFCLKVLDFPMNIKCSGHL